MITAYLANNVWIEYIDYSIDLEDAAGEYNGPSTTLERPGKFIAGGLAGRGQGGSPNVAQSLGLAVLRRGGGQGITAGNTISTIRVEVFKQASTEGSTVSLNYHVFLILGGPPLNALV